MDHLLREFRHNRVLWLLVALPAMFAVEFAKPDAHTLVFLLSIAAIVPLGELLSRASESVAARTGDMVGGLLTATFGNLTELMIALTALAAGEYLLVKATIAGGIITKTLLILGLAFLTGGLKYHVQEFNRANARLQACLVLLATVALLLPSVLVGSTDAGVNRQFIQHLSLAVAILLFAAYVLSIVFTLGTHSRHFSAKPGKKAHGKPWPMPVAVAVLVLVTLLTALVSEAFVESMQHAAATFGMTAAFVGLVIVSLVGGAAEMMAAVSAARNDRLDMSIGIGLGGADQMVLFAAPVLVFASYVIGPSPMTLQFWPAVLGMMLIATLTTVLITAGGRSAWFIGVMLINVYLIFAVTLYLLPAPPPA